MPSLSQFPRSGHTSNTTTTAPCKPRAHSALLLASRNRNTRTRRPGLSLSPSHLWRLPCLSEIMDQVMDKCRARGESPPPSITCFQKAIRQLPRLQPFCVYNLYYFLVPVSKQPCTANHHRPSECVTSDAMIPTAINERPGTRAPWLSSLRML